MAAAWKQVEVHAMPKLHMNVPKLPENLYITGGIQN